MAGVPVAYTENELAEYMETVLADLGEDLGLSASAGDFSESVIDTLLDYGVTAITEISGAKAVRKLRALARVNAWRLAVARCAPHYDFKDGDQSLTRSQLQDQAQEALSIAQADALVYDTRYRVGVDRVAHVHDPYQYWPDDRRTR